MKKNNKYFLIIGICSLLCIGYFIADNILFDGIRPKNIREKGIHAQLFLPKKGKNNTTVVLLGGGQWGDYWGQYFAKNNFTGLSLAYTRQPGLPLLPEAIDLAYFENALRWLQKQPAVAPNKIVVMGASRNAELALVLAATFPELIHGVIAYAPSSVSWSNTVLPFNSDDLKASWVYHNQDIPYVPMDKIKPDSTGTLQMLSYWQRGLSKPAAKNAAIAVENIQGPILLFSGLDDQVWPSASMANQIENRLQQQNFSHSVQNIQYAQAGHLITTNPDQRSKQYQASLLIEGTSYPYNFGGNSEGDVKAKQDARTKLMQFLKKL